MGVPVAILAAYKTAVNSLFLQPRAFAARALKPIYAAAEAEAILIDVSSLKPDGIPLTGIITSKVEDITERCRILLSQNLVKQTLATSTGLSAEVVEQLLENKEVLKALSGTGSAMEDFQDLNGTGLDAEYFSGALLKTPPPSVRQIDESLGFEWSGQPPALGIPVTGFSARWTGHLYVPATAEINFQIRCTDGVRLIVNSQRIIDEWKAQPESQFDVVMKLDGGQFYPIELTYFNTSGDAMMILSWSSPSIPATIIPKASFYPAQRLADLLQRIERMYKFALLLTPLRFTALDLQGLSKHGDLKLDLMKLDGPVPLPDAQAMFAQWVVIYGYALLRDKYTPSELSLLDVINADSDETAIENFFILSGFATGTIKSAIAGFTLPLFDPVLMTWKNEAPVLGELSWWIPISNALEMVEKTGAAPKQLFAWAKTREINQLPTGPETAWYYWKSADEKGVDRHQNNIDMAQNARNIVRACYSEDRWRGIARTLNDNLRISRRSALTVYMLAMPEMMHANVSDSGRLFEFLLIDVEMDPCMETSRIKQGISSVQLFIQRVLLNLESPEVPPERIDRARWEWSRVYRVWEANRKLFLYPESYLEEELRDDKTPIFEEFESELLQDELNESNSEKAFRHYLEKLDKVAKLIVCGSCEDTNNHALHVFARTATSPFVFYHRWLDNKNGYSYSDGIWSPWQKLPVDVASIDEGSNSGAHLMPVFWNRRLYLFWPLFEQKPDQESNANLPEGFDQVDCWHIKLAWSEYKDDKWSLKQTGSPFIISPSYLDKYDDPGNTFPFLRGPDHATITTSTEDWTGVAASVVTGLPLGGVDKHSSKRTVAIDHRISREEDEMLEGIVLSKDGDFARRIHSDRSTTIHSFLPRPADHYLDLRFTGSGLTIRVFRRFKGLTKKTRREFIEDYITVVVDGKRSDRHEKSQEDYLSVGEEIRIFEKVGEFHFPACTSELDASQSSGKPLAFNSLERPQDTMNSYMALHQDWPRVAGLRLTTGINPILKFVPNRFSVIDADNRSGFNHRGPFFYQDQERCYLVFREHRHLLFEGPKRLEVDPSMKYAFAKYATAFSTVSKKGMSMAATLSIQANPWTKNALKSWAKGPAIPAIIRNDSIPLMQTFSGSLNINDLFLHDKITNLGDRIFAKANPEYVFIPHWHPYTCPFIASINKDGLPGLFTLENESRTDFKLLVLGVIGGGGPITIIPASNFSTIYKPDPDQVVQPYPQENVDFSLNGSYSKYNWETFFHAPMTVAIAYSRAGKFEEAMRWYHFVFDPMTNDPDKTNHRFWQFKPFRDEDDILRIEETVLLLSYTGSDAIKLKQKVALQVSIQEWMANPFKPHILARLRPGVYMKYVFTKYLDNIIAWADDLFNRDTIEFINEATQLYILMANMIGPKLQRTPAPGPVAPKTYQELRGKLDELSNAQVDLETRLPFTQLFNAPTGTPGLLTKLPQALYFCLPQNDKMLAYWDIIADRLFKIRHCMSLDGTVRQLPLFEPPIDPMLLVEAVAHGLDIGSILSDLYAPLPRYRFAATLQQALTMCNEVRSLGNTLLSMIEKGDAELLSAVRAGQETQLLNQIRVNKKLQIDEAEESLQALSNTARMVNGRIEYYENLIKQGLISEESDQLNLLDSSNQWQQTASWIEATAQALNMIPNISTGQNNASTFGGSNLGSAASAVGRSFSFTASSLSYLAGRSSITGGHTRRSEDWRFQRDQAKRELSQVERQQAAARIRKAITQADLRTQDVQIENARIMEEKINNKFTNKAIYNYLEGTVRTIYYQCYQAAYEIAKRAERCWQYERGTDAVFIKYGSWDSSVRGLLAGERLYLQLKQMERAYLEQQSREFEITKHISIVQLDPLALIALKEAGSCEVDIPEWLFDLDYPGHYFRRIKTVSISIPAVVGPYTSLSATLTLLNSKLRKTSTVSGNYGDDENYRSDHLAVEAIAASIGQNDNGRFQLEFRDEQYLPFEGAGAISRFRIELPHKFRSFDYDTISDVIIHMRYTSRQDGILKDQALTALQNGMSAAGGSTGMLFRFFSLRHEFPNEWQKLMTSVTHEVGFTILKERLPLLVQGGTVVVKEIQSAIILKEPRPALGYKAVLTVGTAAPVNLQWPGQAGRYRIANQVATVNFPISADPLKSVWKLKINSPALPADIEVLKDILIVVNYSVVF